MLMAVKTVVYSKIFADPWVCKNLRTFHTTVENLIKRKVGRPKQHLPHADVSLAKDDKFSLYWLCTPFGVSRMVCAIHFRILCGVGLAATFAVKTA